MSLKKVWIGSVGPYLFESDDFPGIKVESGDGCFESDSDIYIQPKGINNTVYINGSLICDDDAYIGFVGSGTFSASGDIDITADMGSVSINAGYGTPTIYLNNNTEIDGDLTVSGNISGSLGSVTATSLTCNNITSDGDALTLSSGTGYGIILEPNSYDNVVYIMGLLDVSASVQIDGQLNLDGKVVFDAGTTNANGIQWGTDVHLYRSAENVLQTDDDFHFNGDKTLFFNSTTGTIDCSGDLEITAQLGYISLAAGYGTPEIRLGDNTILTGYLDASSYVDAAGGFKINGTAIVNSDPDITNVVDCTLSGTLYCDTISASEVTITADTVGINLSPGNTDKVVYVNGALDVDNNIVVGGTVDGVDIASFYSAYGSHSHAFSAITSKPTTLAGYGITDAAPSSKGVTNGDSHNHYGGDGAKISIWLATDIDSVTGFAADRYLRVNAAGNGLVWSAT